MLAAVIGRKTDMLTSLAFTAIIILMDNPFLLYYSGFVFSFAAIVSIAIVVPAFSPEKNDEHDVEEANIKNYKNKICNKNKKRAFIQIYGCYRSSIRRVYKGNRIK